MDVDENVIYYEGEKKHDFAVDNDYTANWALKAIKEHIAEADRLKAIIANERVELDKKEKDIDERLARETGYLKSLLYKYFGTVKHKDSKTQESYKLLDGSLVFKKPSQKMVPDREKLIAYCEKNNMPEFIKVKKDIDWESYKKECEIVDGHVVNVQTGDMLPEDMIQIEEKPGSFDIK